MKKILIALVAIGFLMSCEADNPSCKTCTATTSAGNIVTEYCQNGADVIQTTDGVKSTVSNKTVEDIVNSVSQLPNTTCN